MIVDERPETRERIDKYKETMTKAWRESKVIPKVKPIDNDEIHDREKRINVIY